MGSLPKYDKAAVLHSLWWGACVSTMVGLHV